MCRTNGFGTAAQCLRKSLLRCGTAFALFCAITGTCLADVSAWVDAEMDTIARLYLYLHRHPELSLYEKETAARIAQEWRDAGYEVTTAIGGHGVVGMMKNGAGPCVMLRCDLDALPVTEATGLEYASKVTTTIGTEVPTGVMHACGHDIHMANLVGVARYLAAHKDEWKGTLMLVGQPAEERGMGAKEQS